jgi:hydroxyacylglutathione hydrolase
MDILALPAFADNYIWMLHTAHQAIVVDPGDAVPVQQALIERELELVGILVTHHHADHIGGILDLLPLSHGPVIGPRTENIPGATHKVGSGDQVELMGLRFDVLDVPGHTSGHIAFYAGAAQPAPILLCGDTLFSAGCGRLFEGTMAQMKSSLDQLSALPIDTRVYCTHEYTLANLRFAAAAEPHNSHIQQYTQHCQALRAQGLPTLPSSIGLELEINPFLRCSTADVIASAKEHGAKGDNSLAVFSALRRWKDTF